MLNLNIEFLNIASDIKKFQEMVQIRRRPTPGYAWPGVGPKFRDYRPSCRLIDNYGGECLTLPFDFLDSPATTSSITYGIRLMFFSGVSSTTIYMNRATSSGDYIYRPLAISTITAMEIST